MNKTHLGARRTLFVPLIGIAFVLVGGDAFAFKSERANATHTPPTPPPLFPFPGHGFGVTGEYWENDIELVRPPAQSSNGGLRYLFHVIHEAHAGIAGLDQSLSILPGLYLCPSSARNGSLEGCVPLSTAAAQLQKWPWLESRLAWDSPKSEHLTITKTAAAIAGLPSSLGAPFYLRYPSFNSLIASPAKGEAGKLVVGQSLVPAGFDNGPVQVLRAVSLYELSQAPDKSFSLADWAGGNEICQLTDIDGAFDSGADPGRLACHDYFGAVGTLNASHFAPGSRSVYTYYHQLALARMDSCNQLKDFAKFYGHASDGVWEPVASPQNTEAHECEREAFTYEMFAQHFLQDAWATGHMWHAWGYSQLSQYPTTLEPIVGSAPDTTLPPAENLQGRRALIADVVGLFRGMVHGDKPVARQIVGGDAFREKFAGYINWFPNAEVILNGLADDPLSYPLYSRNGVVANLFGFSELTPVMWRNTSGVIAPGAGDEYGYVLLDLAASEDLYAEARKRLLMCTATSLREVYERGPKAHGALGTFTGAWDRNGFDFATECWSQRATNASMYGSVAPIRVSYQSTPILEAPAVFGIVNQMLIPETEKHVRLPEAVDREAFVLGLLQRMNLDAIRVTNQYAINVAKGGEEGTQSAVGTPLPRTGIPPAPEEQADISFLGVPSGRELHDDPPLPYLDVATPPVPETVNPQYYFMQHMFWRSHVKEVCAQDNLIQQLRDRCVNGAAQPGGDPDACTKCAEVAELHMPTAWLDDIAAHTLGPSKCATLGYPGGGGLPEIYRDFEMRVNAVDASGYPLLKDRRKTGYPSYYPAFSYCTGTDDGFDPFLSTVGRLSRLEILSTTPGQTVDCAKPPDPPNTPEFTRGVSNSTSRFAVAINESSLYADPGWPTFSNVWVPPIITAFEDTWTSSIVDSDKFCGYPGWGWYGWRLNRTTDPIVENAIGNAPFWDSEAEGNSMLPKYVDQESMNQLRFGVCGLGQRVSFHNRPCATALAGIHRQDLIPKIGLGFQQDTGAMAIEIAAQDNMTMCSVREPREVMRCAPGFGECTAGGLCSIVGRPTVTVFHETTK